MFSKKYLKIKKFVSVLFVLTFVVSAVLPAGIVFATNNSSENENNEQIEKEKTSKNITIVATAIKCLDEADLPNWGNGGPDISSTTAIEFLATNTGRCHPIDDWRFEWGNQTVTSPGDAYLWDAGITNGWTIFGPTNLDGVTTANISFPSSVTEIRIREVLESGFIPFTYDQWGDNSNPISAELYCSNDVVNYDNFDFIYNPTNGSTYHCIAFNSWIVANNVNTPPTITLLGNNPATTTIGQIYIDLGATATDLEDGDATTTRNIVVSGFVNASTTGTYILTYVVKDSGNLYATTTRTVIVEATSTPPVLPPVTPPTTPENPPVVSSGSGSNSSSGGGGGSLGGGHRHPIVLGEVLSATSCFYLRDYLKIDRPNDSVEVLKLQSFLNVFEKENLSLTGVFNQSTFEAVQRFQLKYKEDILAPWGDKVTTGFVYILTKKKVNEIYCNSIFPVSSLDQKEIDSFKSSLSDDKNTSVRGNSGSVLNNDISSKLGFLGDALNDSDVVVELKDTVTSPTSVVRNAAVSLFALPQKLFNGCSNSSPIWIILILLTIIAILARKLLKSKNLVLENGLGQKEVSPIVAMPNLSHDDLPEEELLIIDDEELIEGDDIKFKN